MTIETTTSELIFDIDSRAVFSTRTAYTWNITGWLGRSSLEQQEEINQKHPNIIEEKQWKKLKKRTEERTQHFILSISGVIGEIIVSVFVLLGLHLLH